MSQLCSKLCKSSLENLTEKTDGVAMEEQQESQGSTSRKTEIRKGEFDVLVSVVAFLVVAVWVAWGAWANRYIQFRVPISAVAPEGSTMSDLERAGQFGDMFGTLNALFTALAFVAVWWTGRMQKRELELQRNELTLQRTALELQRQELRDTRKELHAQTEHFADQNATLAQQSADNTFFQLLRLHNDIVNSIDLMNKPRGTTIARGRDCFQIFCHNLRAEYEAQLQQKPRGSDYEVIQRAYMSFYDKNQADIGHYFRSIYNLIKFIDRSRLQEKRTYTNLVRAQLSSYEVMLLFYNCISPLGEDKFKPLVERYGLLKHVPREKLFHDGNNILYFSAAAYA
jgi:hypothetical protein